MNQVDLNIDNYDLNDILSLFKLNINFTREDLKAAKRMVLKTHPDKSKLDKEYFLFFSKAYKMLYQIYEFKNQSNTKSTQYVADKDEEHERILEDIKGKENFNEWFNDLFEKTQQSSLDNSAGYGDWLKSEEDCCASTAHNMDEMNREIDSRKEQMRDLIPHQDIDSMNGNMGFNILDSEAGYQSSVFSNLQYEDLKKAHVESVIPVTHTDYTSRKKFNSVNEIQAYRSQQDTKPFSLEQSRKYLDQRDSNESERSSHRAFQLAKECEVNQEKNKEWWSHVKRISQ